MTALAPKAVFGTGTEMDPNRQEKARECFQLRRMGNVGTQIYKSKPSKSTSQEELSQGPVRSAQSTILRRWLSFSHGDDIPELQT